MQLFTFNFYNFAHFKQFRSEENQLLLMEILNLKLTFLKFLFYGLNLLNYLHFYYENNWNGGNRAIMAINLKYLFVSLTTNYELAKSEQIAAKL